MNRYGLDVDYFTKKIKLIIRDINNYTPDEFARECARMSVTADKTVVREMEFSSDEEEEPQ